MRGLQLVGQAGPVPVVPVTGPLRAARVLVVERRAVHPLAGSVATAVAVDGAVATADFSRLLGRSADRRIDAGSVWRDAVVAGNVVVEREVEGFVTGLGTVRQIGYGRSGGASDAVVAQHDSSLFIVFVLPVIDLVVLVSEEIQAKTLPKL
jgi:hypothetical protein